MKYPENFLKGLRKITNNLSQDSRCLSRDPDRALPEHNSRALAADKLVRWLVDSREYRARRQEGDQRYAA
jgi:hypothetical protein